jgi:uncharacterized paraquat-inducible protein A
MTRIGEGKIVRCSCGRLYKFVPYTVRDQSMCPRCEAKLEEEWREYMEMQLGEDELLVGEEGWR